MSVPTAAELNPSADPKGGAAEQHFLGKTVDEAVKQFEDDSKGSAEDLMWMGPRAFVYYLPAAIQYLQSDAAVMDFRAPTLVRLAIEHQLDEDPVAIADALPIIKTFSAYVIWNGKRFSDESDEIIDLESDYGETLQRAIAELQKATARSKARG